MKELQTQRMIGVSEPEISIVRDGQLMACSVATFEVKGVSACFPLPDPPVLSIGEGIEVVIYTDRRETASARVVSRVDRSNEREFGFEFLQPDRLAEKIPLIYGLINRRRFVRVVPPKNEEFTVELSANDSEIAGRMNDISLGGIGVRISSADEVELSDVVRLRVELSTPYQDCPYLSLEARIRSLRLLNQCITHLGIEFDVIPDKGARDLESVLKRLEKASRQQDDSNTDARQLVARSRDNHATESSVARR